MQKLGLRNSARSPGSIQNAEHHDQSGSGKNSSGTPGTYSSIIPTSTATTPLKPASILRIANMTATFQFVYIGSESTVPGTVDATNSLALPPNSADVFFCGVSEDDQKSIVVKSSSASVQIAIIEI